jgi:hypothetical protein
VPPVLDGSGRVYVASVSGDLWTIDGASGTIVATAQLSSGWAPWPFGPYYPAPTNVTVLELLLGTGVLLVSAVDSNGNMGTIYVGLAPTPSPTPLPEPPAKAGLSAPAAAGLAAGGGVLAACAALALALQWWGLLEVKGRPWGSKGAGQHLPLLGTSDKA